MGAVHRRDLPGDLPGLAGPGVDDGGGRFGDDVDVTGQTPGVLAPEDLEALRAVGRPARYEKGQTLCRQGDRNDSVVIVSSGWVKVVASAPDGGEVVLAVRGPDDLIGDLAAIDGRDTPRSATVVALHVVRGHVLRGEEFRAFLASHGATALALSQTIVRRLRDADRRQRRARQLRHRAPPGADAGRAGRRARAAL